MRSGGFSAPDFSEPGDYIICYIHSKFLTYLCNITVHEMSSSKSKNPFQGSPEEELQNRLKKAKRLTREEFEKRIQHSRKEKLKNK